MSQKQRTLAILVGAIVVSAVLGGVVFRTDRDEEAKKAADEKTAQLNSFDSTKVVSIKVVARGETTEAQKAGDRWEIVSPIHAPADVGVLDGVVGRLVELKSKAVVEASPADLGKYGLAAPAADVELKGPDIDVHMLFGDSNGFNQSEYVKRAGEPAVYLADGSAAQFEKTTFDLRDKRVRWFDTKSVRGLSVKSPSGDFTLVPNGAGWRLTAPLAEAADDSVVNNVLNLLSNLRSIAIPEENPKDLALYGLDNPARTAEVKMEGHTLTFSFGSPAGKEKDELYARSDASPTVFKLMVNAIDGLKQTPATLEDKTVVSFDPSAVAALTLTAGPTTVIVQRKRVVDGGSGPEGWTQMSPVSGDAKGWRINGLVRNLANLRAAKVNGSPSDLKPYGLDAPHQTVTVQDNSGTTLAELLIGGEGEGNLYVKLKNDPRVFEVEHNKLGALPEKGDDLLLLPPDAGAL